MYANLVPQEGCHMQHLPLPPKHSTQSVLFNRRDSTGTAKREREREKQEGAKRDVLESLTILILPHIQGVPGGTDQTSEECSLC